MRKIVPTLLVAAVVVAGVIALTGGSDKYVVYVKANDAGGILKNYNVKVGEVAAGKITDIRLDKQDHAVLKMEMDKGAVPIGAGASARIRPVNLLGEKYVDLDPGDLTKPQPSGTTIPASRTSTPIELDDALNTLDPDTRGALRIIINEAGLSMAGHGTDFNQTLTDLPPALDAAKRVVTEADQENVRLRSLVTQGDRALRTIGPKSTQLGDLVSSAADALQTVAQRRAQLGRTVANAPAALSQLRATLVKLQAASGQLTPAADDLLRTAPQLDQTLKRVPQFASDASATLAEVRKVSPALARLGRQSTPTLRTLRPTVNRLATFTGDIKPLIDTLDQGHGAHALLAFANGWTSVTDQRDGLSHVFRLSPTVDLTLLQGIIERNLKTALPPAAARKQTPARKTARPAATAAPSASAPAAQPAAPKLIPNLVKPVTNGLGQALQDVSGAVAGLLGGKKGSPPGASPAPPRNDAGKILNYLLGP